MFSNSGRICMKMGIYDTIVTLLIYNILKDNYSRICYCTRSILTDMLYNRILNHPRTIYMEINMAGIDYLMHSRKMGILANSCPTIRNNMVGTVGSYSVIGSSDNMVNMADRPVN